MLLVIGSGREDRGGRGPFEAGHECVDLVHWQLHVACHATHQLDVTHRFQLLVINTAPDTPRLVAHVQGREAGGRGEGRGEGRAAWSHATRESGKA